MLECVYYQVNLSELNMGIFFRSFPSKKETPAAAKNAPVKPEPAKTGKVTPHEYEGFVKPEISLSKRFNPIQKREIEIAIRGALKHKDSGSWQYQGVSGKEAKDVAEILKESDKTLSNDDLAFIEKSLTKRM